MSFRLMCGESNPEGRHHLAFQRIRSYRTSVCAATPARKTGVRTPPYWDPNSDHVKAFLDIFCSGKDASRVRHNGYCLHPFYLSLEPIDVNRSQRWACYSAHVSDQEVVVYKQTPKCRLDLTWQDREEDCAKAKATPTKILDNKDDEWKENTALEDAN
ncbi:hypothetical protein LTS08_000320 [Lithohypha guttulata]|nr:hypothetical protein LTS08_000320 [Lithohypha guttulata]